MKVSGRAVTKWRSMPWPLHHPVHVGDEVSVYAKLASVGRTSAKIAVESWQRNLTGETATKVTEAIFTFVAVDQNGKPRPFARRP